MANNALAPRILLVKTSSLGDVVHNLPVATALRARFPEAAIDWLVEEAYTDVARLHPAVGRVIPVALRRWRRRLFACDTWREIASCRRELRRVAYDLVLDSQGLIKSALIARQAQLSPRGERVGYCAEAAREALAARAYDRCVGIPRNLHAVLRNRWLAAAAVGDAPDEEVDYGIASATLAADWLPQTPYALLVSASSRADKSWPAASWLALAACLANRGLSPVLPSGTADEQRQAQSLAAAMGGQATAAPLLPLAQVAGLCAGARLVVGLDTGLVHLAAALGRPTLCLFSGSDPALTGVLAGSSANPVRNLGQLGRAASAAEACAVAAELLDASAS